MAVTVLPDVGGAIVARLRSFPEILALITTASGYDPSSKPADRKPRVSPEIQDAWAMPTHAVWVQGPIGDPLPEASVHGAQWSRFDLHCYGTTGYEAGRLWRTVHPAFCPRQGISASFVAAGCTVGNVVKEGGPIRNREPETRWVRFTATYLVLWSEVPAA